MNEKKLDLLLSLALLVLVVMAFLPMVNVLWSWRPYVYAVGAVLAAVVRVWQRFRYRKDRQMSLAVRRLHNIEFWSALCFLVSALFMIINPHKTDWIAFLMAGAVIQIYTSFRLQYVLKKEAGRKSEGKEQ